MSVDTDALAHIMNVLTDLYSDPELAIIREYSTNALDSHVEAGVSRPIEVMTPTDLRPLFTVRDYGTGLDADDIREIYSRYGASTRRGTNDAVGMLGLGCKSALAYVDQFTLTGIKSGQRVVVSVSRDENGAGTMTVLESGETEEPDGVEVAIPAKRGNELAAKAADFFSHWQPGTVLLDGAEPEQASGRQIGDDFLIITRRLGYEARQRGTVTPRLQIVMGNVSYPAPNGYEHDAVTSLPDAKGIIARVPIGHVAFVPSREGLQDSPATRRALDETLDAFADGLRKVVATEIENADDMPSAAKALVEIREALGESAVSGAKWQGKTIPAKFGFPEITPTPTGKQQAWQHDIWHCYPHAHSYRRQSERMMVSSGVRLDLAQRAVWLLDYDNDSWSASQRRKLDAYLEAHDVCAEGGAADILQTDADHVPLSDWLDPANVVSWEDVRKWRDPAKSAELGGRTYAGTYPVHTVSTVGGAYQDGKPSQEIAESNLPLYFWPHGKYYGEARAAGEILGECLIAAMPSTRAAKFQRMFPEAVEIHAAIQAKAEAWLAGLSPTQRKAWATFGKGGGQSEFARLDARKLDDPALRAMVRAAEAWTVKLAGEWKQFAGWMLNMTPDRKDVLSIDSERYPLLGSLLTSRASALYFDHVMMYCNAAYAASK